MTAGRSIVDLIGAEISRAWEAHEAQVSQTAKDSWADPSTWAAERGKARQLKGRILGLAQAVAIIRAAPNQPTPQQVIDITQEFYPGHAEGGS